MHYRRILKQILPPVITTMLKRLSGYTFSGHYACPSDVPSVNGDYASLHLVEQAYNQAFVRLKDAACKERVQEPLPCSQFSNLLPLLVSAMLSYKAKARVLDFGGGFGKGYIDCMETMPCNLTRIEYHIIELGQISRKGKELFSGCDNIYFHDFIPEQDNYDIANIGSSLQYIEDYCGVLEKICLTGAKFILMTDHYMGNCKTYATAQINFKPLRMPYWIFNRNEIRQVMADNGYDLIYQSSNLQEHTFTHVCPEAVVAHSLNLLFTFNGKQGEES